MKRITYPFLFSIIFMFFCCKNRLENRPDRISKPNKVVVISVNAPKEYVHLIQQDSVGKKLKDSLGPKMFYNNNGFTYLDHMNIVQTWRPKPNALDTIRIENYNEYLELSTRNFFTSIDETFLVKDGDTIIFNYEHNIAKAIIINRNVNEVELNYNSYRLRKLFDNKYTSHFMVFGNMFLNKNIHDFEQKSIEYYNQANLDFAREVKLLDSLKNEKIISQLSYRYRKDALNMLMEKHKNLKNIRKWIEKIKPLSDKDKIEPIFGFDLANTDSLMKFSFFRAYLIAISQYNINFIKEDNGNSGGYYIDSRIRFDSILNDNRFNQMAKNFLLFDAYNGIGQNFRVKDKEKYFKKLQVNTTNIEQLNQIIKDYNLDFSKAKDLVLTNHKNDTLTFAKLLESHKGKWLYIDFWASWCKPCRELMPKSNKLREELKEENLEFIYLSLNDNKEKWKRAIEKDSLSEIQNYFIENGNTSKVIEDLGIKTIPHYLIYNPKGELVNGFAKRPGDGAKEQLKKHLGY